MYPKPTKMNFYANSIIFIVSMFVLAIIGVCIVLPQLIALKVTTKDLFIRTLDLFTICVPPVLPIAMSVSVSLAIWRLRRQSIYCISSLRVNIAGKVGLICFDKTGTLTENHLDLQTVVSATDKVQEVSKKLDTTLTVSNPELLKCLSTCHSITTMNNQLVGDSMDVVLFQSLDAVRFFPVS